MRNRTVLYILIAVVVAGVVWVFAPAGYTSTLELLPSSWSSRLSSQTAEDKRLIGKLEARVGKLESMNRQLRVNRSSTLSGTTTLPDTFQSASVLARPPQTAYDVLLINKGVSDEVQAGAAVWWPPGVYLGKVIEARAKDALVRLVSSSGVRHAARIENGLTVTTEGRGGGSMITAVPAGSSVASGTQVVSDRYSVPFARVVGQRETEGLAQRRLFLQPIVSASVIEYVHVEQ